jgi:hypothetical protein
MEGVGGVSWAVSLAEIKEQSLSRLRSGECERACIVRASSITRDESVVVELELTLRDVQPGTATFDQWCG